MRANNQALAAGPAPEVEKRAREWAPLFLAYAASRRGAADDDAEADPAGADSAAESLTLVGAASRVGGKCAPRRRSLFVVPEPA